MTFRRDFDQFPRIRRWCFVALSGLLISLLLTGCQSEQEKVLNEVESLMEAGDYIEAYQLLTGFPTPEEGSDEFDAEERQQLLARKADLRNKLVPAVVEVKLETGAYNEALEVLDENLEGSLRSQEDTQHEEYQQLAERVLAAMYEADENADQLLEIVVDPWHAKSVHRDIIDDLIEQHHLDKAESEIERHESAFETTEEGVENVATLTRQLEEVKYGEIGSPEFYLGKSDDLMAGDNQNLEEAVELLEEFINKYPDHGQVADASQRKELSTHRLELQQILPPSTSDISSRAEAQETIDNLERLRLQVTDDELREDIEEERARVEEHKELLGRNVDSADFLRRVRGGVIHDEDARYRIRASFLKRNDQWLLSAQDECRDSYARSTRTPLRNTIFVLDEPETRADRLDEPEMKDYLVSQIKRFERAEDSGDGCAFGPYDLTVKERRWSGAAGEVEIRRINY